MYVLNKQYALNRHMCLTTQIYGIAWILLHFILNLFTFFGNTAHTNLYTHVTVSLEYCASLLY